MRPTSLTRSVLRQALHCCSGRPTLRSFHTATRLQVVKPFLLADIGEGIRECEIIQWFVEPEARVEEFDKICEVQSDKASVDIPSRFTGVIKRLHYEAGEMAIVGKPLVDIDVREEDQDEIPAAAESTTSASETAHGSATLLGPEVATKETNPVEGGSPNVKKGKHSALATPAVRHLSKELDVQIEEVTGTGKDGRVSKEDIYKFVEERNSGPSTSSEGPSDRQYVPPAPQDDGPQVETKTELSKMQQQMFKTMTRSLAIPHFLYADETDFTALSTLRQKLNKSLAKSADGPVKKLSYLPFIIKAMSLSLHQYPILNARVEIGSDSQPAMVMRSQHNIGIAMDTPLGLLVPVLKNVGSMNIMAIAQELKRLQSLAATGKFSSSDLSGGTITLSNIGSIGGTYVSPVIVDKEVAILGVGKMRTVPAFDDQGNVTKKQICNFSWSADHRVVDGATMARAAEVVRGFVESPAMMMLHLR